MMKHVLALFLAMTAIVCVGISKMAIAEAIHNPWLSSTPNPPPANQEFPATLHYFGNPGMTGFWGEEHPLSVIDGNVITFMFDTGCGWICPPGNPQYNDFTFIMPALPEGRYTVRLADSLTPGSSAMAQFEINIGQGGMSPTTLPLGGYWNLSLAALLLALALLHPRARLRDTNSIN
jgi:hypothetical protein